MGAKDGKLSSCRVIYLRKELGYNQVSHYLILGTKLLHFVGLDYYIFWSEFFCLPHSLRSIAQCHSSLPTRHPLQKKDIFQCLFYKKNYIYKTCVAQKCKIHIPLAFSQFCPENSGGQLHAALPPRLVHSPPCRHCSPEDLHTE